MMMTQIENPLPTKQDQDLLRVVYTQARRFMLYRERAQAMQARMEEMPDSLAEAIERDFAAFELEDAARAVPRGPHCRGAAGWPSPGLSGGQGLNRRPLPV